MFKILHQSLRHKIQQFIGQDTAETQSNFAKGKQILDEILITSEVVDDVKKRKKKLILFKVDFKKA